MSLFWRKINAHVYEHVKQKKKKVQDPNDNVGAIAGMWTRPPLRRSTSPHQPDSH